MPSFQKSLIVEQFQGNYLKLSNPAIKHPACCTKACALGPRVARQGPGPHKHRQVTNPAVEHVATSCIARCCFEILRAFGQALRIKNMTAPLLGLV